MTHECKAYMDGIKDGMKKSVEDTINQKFLELRYEIQDILMTQKLYEEFHGGYKTPREVYVLRMEPKVVQVVCESCYKRGYVSNCPTCGGRGVHKKTYQQWGVKPHKEIIEKIDRDRKTGKLRYWTSSCEFYEETILETGEPRKYFDEAHNGYPNGVHMVQFNLSEAQAECERLNKILITRGVLV